MRSGPPFVALLSFAPACAPGVDGVWRVRYATQDGSSCETSFEHNLPGAVESTGDLGSGWEEDYEGPGLPSAFYVLITTGDDGSTRLVPPDEGVIYEGLDEGGGAWTFTSTYVRDNVVTRDHPSGYAFTSTSHYARDSTYEIAFDGDLGEGDSTLRDASDVEASEPDTWDESVGMEEGALPTSGLVWEDSGDPVFNTRGGEECADAGCNLSRVNDCTTLGRLSMLRIGGGEDDLALLLLQASEEEDSVGQAKEPVAAPNAGRAGLGG